MIEYFGNCSNLIDWTSIVQSCESQEPAYVGPRHRPGDDTPGLDQVADQWRTAGYRPHYDGGNAAWDMYLSGTNFDRSVIETFADWVGADLSKPYYAWISRVRPGYVVPWHWDVTDDESVLIQKDDFVRFHCHITPPTHGHVLMVEDRSFYYEALGNTYKWPSRKSWHGGANCGFTSKYTFHFWA